MAAISPSTSFKTNICIPDPVIMLRGRSVVCMENGCKISSDAVAQQLYDSVKQIQVFFFRVFGLCGVDGKGGTPRFEIGWNGPNARWDCSGNSCQWQFRDAFAKIPEVAAHEITHAVVQYARTTPLVFSGESGALNESIANVLAVAFSHWAGRKDWKVGTSYDLSVHADRSHFQTGDFDSGYIHANSNIPSHAFFMAVNLTESAAYGLIAHIWFSAMSRVSSSTTFVEFARTTLQLSPVAKGVQQAVLQSWLHVGVLKLQVPKPVKEPSLLERVAGFVKEAIVSL